MLRALIYKDLLANRLPLLLAACLLVASYVAAAIIYSQDGALAVQSGARRVGSVLMAGSLVSHGLAQLSLAVLAGNLIAAERVNRSAEFLAYLPPSRGMVLSAKAIVLAGAALVLLFIPLVVGGLAAFITETISADSFRRIAILVASISALGLCASGVGWLASCCLDSNALAILFALGSPWILTVVVSSASGGKPSQAILLAAYVSVGLAGFLFGTRHFLNRVEP
jgi:ABC-type transport system involved in multi-copper enzyme maturation permease subunit